MPELMDKSLFSSSLSRLFRFFAFFPLPPPTPPEAAEETEGEESLLPAAEEQSGVQAEEPLFQSEIANDVSDSLGSKETGVEDDEDEAEEEELMEEADSETNCLDRRPSSESFLDATSDANRFVRIIVADGFLSSGQLCAELPPNCLAGSLLLLLPPAGISEEIFAASINSLIVFTGLLVA